MEQLVLIKPKKRDIQSPIVPHSNNIFLPFKTMEEIQHASD